MRSEALFCFNQHCIISILCHYIDQRYIATALLNSFKNSNFSELHPLIPPFPDAMAIHFHEMVPLHRCQSVYKL